MESEAVDGTVPGLAVRLSEEYTVVGRYWLHEPEAHKFLDGSGTFGLDTDIWKSSLSTTLTKDPAEFDARRFDRVKVSVPATPFHGLLKVSPARLNGPLLPPLENVTFMFISAVVVPARPDIVTSGVQLGSRGTVLMRATVI